MARCRSYLRGLDICVTVLLLVSGVVMISVGFSSTDSDKPVAKLLEKLSSSDGLLVLQVLGPITVVLSLLGLCAASLDIKSLLLLFSALTFVEFVALIVVASPLIQIQAQMDSAVEEVFVNVTPLHKQQTYIKQELSKLQASESCCGLRSFEDWEEQFPASCLCTSPTPFPLQSNLDVSNVSSVDSCVLAVRIPLNIWVHSEPCGAILKSYLVFPIKVRIGIISAVTTITLSGISIIAGQHVAEFGDHTVTWNLMFSLQTYPEIAAIALSLALGLEERWRGSAAESTVDEYNRVKYQPQPYFS